MQFKLDISMLSRALTIISLVFLALLEVSARATDSTLTEGGSDPLINQIALVVLTILGLGFLYFAYRNSRKK
ncbi:MAG: hypothetical protein JXR10_13675 [Cyclobacteriaceae bacterium]